MRRDVLHVDFLRVDADVAVTVEVPIVLHGEAHDVISNDGQVDQALYHLGVNDIVLAATTTAKDVVEAQSPKTAVLFPADAGSAAVSLSSSWQQLTVQRTTAAGNRLGVHPTHGDQAHDHGDSPYGGNPLSPKCPLRWSGRRDFTRGSPSPWSGSRASARAAATHSCSTARWSRPSSTGPPFG